MGETAVKNRMIHFDLLRILACFSVVVLHSAAMFWYDRAYTDPVWLASNTYDALFRFGVPCFVMMSGALFLSPQKKLDTGRLYTHNILRIVVLFVVWSCVYGVLDIQKRSVYENLSVRAIVEELIGGRYHLWYLPMLVGIYMLLPVLKSWIAHADRKNVEYFLALFFFMQIVRCTIKAFFPGRDDIAYLMEVIDVDMACGYVGYFILGYYVVHVGINKRYHRWIYLGGILGELLGALCSDILTVKKGVPYADVYDSFSVFTFLVVLALFLFFTEVVSKHCFKPWAERIIHEVSAATLGIYVMHIAFLELLQTSIFAYIPQMIRIGIPLLAVVCFIVCCVAAAVLRRIPVLGRYLV